MTDTPDREDVRRRVRERAGKAPQDDNAAKAATNLMLADVVLRMGNSLLRGGVERVFLKGRFGSDAPEELPEKPSKAHKFGAMALAGLATRSLPGAAIVGTGILGKLIYDQSRIRRARKAGDNKDAGLQIEDRTDQGT